MSTDDILLRISELKAEIARLDDSDAQSREQLNELAERMEKRLHAQARDEEEAPFDTVSDLIRRYEAQHPRVTSMLNDIMTRLASMGI